MVLIDQNPGEGSDPTSIGMNGEYRASLEAFVRKVVGYEELNSLIASHMFRWRIFKGKGIFREGGAGKVSLLADGVRPSFGRARRQLPNRDRRGRDER